MPTSYDNIPLNALKDVPDYRDRYYEPALIQLKSEIDPPGDLEILDQGTEGACTGFGLAAVINKLYQDRRSNVRVSARMLYEMARRFDRWPGEGYDGSSCRGAIKGWYHSGVCEDDLWPYSSKSKDRHLTVDRAFNARSHTLGAYYRIRKNIVDMHAALNEVGGVYASAAVHRGWRGPKGGVIKMDDKIIGGHAFAIVGYNTDGFWVQNSWGEKWGAGGLALWHYEDWKENVRDAWVFRLALPTPQLWGRPGKDQDDGGSDSSGRFTLFSSAPRRDEIAGHFVHIDDGQFHEDGRYWSTREDIEETADYIAKRSNYKHLLFYAHGGLNSPKASATRIAAVKETFKANGIYPFHFMYDTGLLEELKDVILGKRGSTEDVMGGFGDFWDKLVEKATRRAGRALWREMKSDAYAAFQSNSRPGRQTIKAFLDSMNQADTHPKKVHMVGHSTGAILIAHALRGLSKTAGNLRIASVSLFAPACTVELFESHYRPLLEAPKAEFGIDKMNVYNLTEDLEEDDNVVHVYRKSLLFLVSNAFEEESEAPILGMEKFSKEIDRPRGFNLVYSDGPGSNRSESETHGGFDNDPATMNDMLKTVLGRNPSVKFTEDNLEY